MNPENLASSSVRVNCNINGDAARILLELKKRGVIQSNREAVVQGLFTLQEKVMKLDLEKAKLKTLTEQKAYLKPWEEVTGTLNGTEITDTEVTAILTCTYKKQIAISLPKDHLETQELKKYLGKKIAIIRTDNPQKPIRIRTYDDSPVAHNSALHGLGLRRSLLWVALKFGALKVSLWPLGLRLR
jgi:hypothetical protein